MQLLFKPKISPADKRQYRLIELPNKLVAMLIQDDQADKSAAAINIQVGSALDPDDLPGAAHFLEHMLFMGTEKYPGEEYWPELIKNSGGFDNAWVSPTDSAFHFDCSNDTFEECLDAFAQFFICPAYTTDCTFREMHAVDSEFNMNLQSDL